MLTCTFAGHREVFDVKQEALKSEIEKLIDNEYEAIFYAGGMGEFDKMCARAVYDLKQKHTDKSIKLILVLPYMKQEINNNIDYYEQMFDEIVIPEVMENVHYKQAITIRNRWMVDRSDIVVSMIRHDFGGAYNCVSYAKGQGKRVVAI